MLLKIKIFVPIFVLCSLPLFGQSNNLPGTRIIGGEEVPPHSEPFQVFLNFTGSDNTAWICAGSLITASYVLTAARCGYGATFVEVILGVHNISEIETTQIKLQSESITLHENFKEDVSAYVSENDIAVIALEESVTLTDSIQLVKLPSGDEPEETYVNKTGKVSGWGQTDAYNSSSLSSVLLSLENTIISNEECTLVYNDLKNYDICMKTVEGESPCVGDYGSPLVVDQVQVGIASQNVMYCIPGYPFVFTRVSSFLDWIKVNTDLVDNNDVTTTS
ncbi:chymotrypsin-like [Anoplophora glabripennis]|uniref:chymotrypsin-like n=1 Tax=Anoplophora glabripennis TaxID=217634 RepID=UPI0008751C83|nr:chymotrypsin-like [Anoplophora glabripennis]